MTGPPPAVPPQAYTALGEAIQAYEPEAMALIVRSPAALLQVLLETGRRAVEAAAPYLVAAVPSGIIYAGATLSEAEVEELRAEAVAAERERCAKLADQHHATWLEPCDADDHDRGLHTHHRRPFAALLRDQP